MSHFVTKSDTFFLFEMHFSLRLFFFHKPPDSSHYVSTLLQTKRRTIGLAVTDLLLLHSDEWTAGDKLTEEVTSGI